MICREFDYDLNRICNATVEELTGIDGIGEVIGQSLVSYFADEKNMRRLEHLLQYLNLEKPVISAVEQKLSGMTFVITGSLEHFENRSELKNRIEALGGKVTGSVTKKTSYLINNDTDNIFFHIHKNSSAKIHFYYEKYNIRMNFNDIFPYITAIQQIFMYFYITNIPFRGKE